MLRLCRHLLHFFIYPNLLLVLCSLLMGKQTIDLFHLKAVNPALLPFIASATLCSYSLHWYLTPSHLSSSPRIAWNSTHKNQLQLLFFVGIFGSFLFFIPLKDHFLAIGIAVVIAFLYTAPKIPASGNPLHGKTMVGKTFLLASTWMYVTTLLPMLVSEQTITPPAAWFCGSRFCLIYSICILFDFKDQEDDRRQGIQSLPTLFNEEQVRSLYYLSLVAFTVCTVAFGMPLGLRTFSVLLLPGFIAATIYPYAIRSRSDLTYYVFLDGLMALSSAITLILPF